MRNDHFCDTTKRASQRLTRPYQQGIPLYHRSGDKPLDATTLLWSDSDQLSGRVPEGSNAVGDVT